MSAETASPKAKGGGKKEKKKNQQGKDKRITVSLKDFQQEVIMGEREVFFLSFLRICLCMTERERCEREILTEPFYCRSAE